LTSLEEVLTRTVVHENSLPAYLVTSDIEVYEDRDVIIQEGNKDKDFFKLVRGKVVVVRAGKKIAEITEPGEYFGEMATMLDEPRCASIISVGRSEIKRYPGDKMDEIIEKYPFIAKSIYVN
jgi:type IV pilus assembly protein PilB